MQARQWEGKREARSYDERRSRIYEHYRSALVQRDPEEIREVMEDVVAYNRKVINDGMRRKVPLITRQAMQRQVRKMTQPSKREMARMQG